MTITSDSTTGRSIDPIDALVPPPRPWWVRLVLALVFIGLVAVGGYLWHSGYFRPAPACCGSSSSSARMGLSADGEAVTVTAHFYNSSPVDMVVTGAAAELPGAKVIDVAVYRDEHGLRIPAVDLAPFPYVLPSHETRTFAITFRPTRCSDDDGDWGRLQLDLERTDTWYPTLERSFTLGSPVASEGSYQLSVSPPAHLEDALQGVNRPLAAACALLEG